MQRSLIGFQLDPWTAPVTLVFGLDSGMGLFVYLPWKECYCISNRTVIHRKQVCRFTFGFNNFIKKARLLGQIHEDGESKGTGYYNK